MAPDRALKIEIWRYFADKFHQRKCDKWRDRASILNPEGGGRFFDSIRMGRPSPAGPLMYVSGAVNMILDRFVTQR